VGGDCLSTQRKRDDTKAHFASRICFSPLLSAVIQHLEGCMAHNRTSVNGGILKYVVPSTTLLRVKGKLSQ
jgi:hypothetical protein